jgi:hypothetical protein
VIKNHTSTKRLKIEPKRNDPPKNIWFISRKNKPPRAMIASITIFIGKEARVTVNMTIMLEVTALRAIKIQTSEKNMLNIVPRKYPLNSERLLLLKQYTVIPMLSMIGRQIRITACMNIFFIISFVSLYGFIISTSMHQTIIKKLKGKGGG